MDASRCELLVHIGAPSSTKDDRRYASVAQSMLDFKPAITTTVVGPRRTPPVPDTVQVVCSVSEKYTLFSNRLVLLSAWLLLTTIVIMLLPTCLALAIALLTIEQIDSVDGNRPTSPQDRS
jgi:hypothetical protein